MASTEATKKEEERRNLAGANPSVYNPDLSVRRQVNLILVLNRS